ncbi:MAG TPA: hypothetical protein VGR73_05150, partial [Bryobacteraceae bacterium]|nr:hypothetical protein [Bryobacteraceae bacterium]
GRRVTRGVADEGVGRGSGDPPYPRFVGRASSPAFGPLAELFLSDGLRVDAKAHVSRAPRQYTLR